MKNSGLFGNLSAKSIVTDNNKVKLEISGVELKSFFISPEMTMKASLKNPEVAGGVSFLL